MCVCVPIYDYVDCVCIYLSLTKQIRVLIVRILFVFVAIISLLNGLVGANDLRKKKSRPMETRCSSFILGRYFSMGWESQP